MHDISNAVIFFFSSNKTNYVENLFAMRMRIGESLER